MHAPPMCAPRTFELQLTFTLTLRRLQLDEPGQKETPDAPKAAAARLEAMGPMTLPQKVMASTLGGAVVLWMFGDLLGVSAVVAAMMGLTVLLTTGVLEWDDCLGYKPAWDTLTWCAVPSALLSMPSSESR